MFIKRLRVVLIMSLCFASCSILKPSLNPEQTKIETLKVVEILATKPDWLDNSSECATRVMPVNEKKVVYLDDGCSNSPKDCLEKCKNEDGNACYALGLLIQKRVDPLSTASIPLFFRSCKYGIVSGCTNFAASKLDLDGERDADSDTCAADTFEQTCNNNDPWGCSMYGTVLAMGIGRQKNIEKALESFDKACVRFGEEDDACKSARQMQQIVEKEKGEKKLK